MKVLVACEFSGRVRDAFIAKGHDSWSVDLLDTDSPHSNHIIGDVLPIAYNGSWDLMIAHPPCTYLSNSGARWLYKGGKGTEPDPIRWKNMEEGAEFFFKLLNAPINKIAVENPIQHGHAQKIINKKYDQIIQPWQFGVGETKSTCLWLKNLPKLISTEIVEGRIPAIHRMPGGKNQGKKRSITPLGFALAMADQWGK